MVRASSGLDVQTLIECGYVPPIAFRSIDDLRAWTDGEGLTPASLGRFSEDNVLLVHGWIQVDPVWSISYRQIWVSILHLSYRKALLRDADLVFAELVPQNRYQLVKGQFAAFDVDHAVSSTFLEAHWSKAWVNVVWSSSRINRSIGAMLEKNLWLPEGNCIRADIGFLLKSFLTRTEKLQRDKLGDYLVEVGREFMVDLTDRRCRREARNATAILNRIAVDAGLVPPWPDWRMLPAP